MTVGLRQLYNEKFHNMYSSSNTIIMIKSRRMRWAEDVGCIVEKLIHSFDMKA